MVAVVTGAQSGTESHHCNPSAATGRFAVFFSLVRVSSPYLREKNTANRPVAATLWPVATVAPLKNYDD